MLNPVQVCGALLALRAQRRRPVSCGQAKPAAQAAAPAARADDSSYPEQGYLSPSALHQRILRLHLRASARRASAPHRPSGFAQRQHSGAGTRRTSSCRCGDLDHCGDPDCERQQAGRENLHARGARPGAVSRRRRTARAEQRPTSRNHQFFLFETRRGIEQHVMLATTIGDYILQVVVAGHDEKM